MYRLGALIPLTVGLLWLAYALLALPLGTPNNPGPALWPVVVACLLTLISTVLLITERSNAEYEPLTKRSISVALGVGSTATFIILFGMIDFIIAAFLLITFWCKYLGRETWLLSLGIAATTSLAFYALFGMLLGVPLPSLLLS